MIGCMYFEYRNAVKHPELANSIGVKFFNLINFSKWTRHTFFIVGWALLTYMIFWNLDEIQGFQVKVWPTWKCALYNSLSRILFV